MRSGRFARAASAPARTTVSTVRTLAATLAATLLATACTLVRAPAVPPPAPQAPPATPPPARDTAPPVPAVVPQPPPAEVPVRSFPEVRGLWVVRTTLTTPERVRTLVTDAEAGGFNTLLVQVRGRGDAYYDARWEPRAPALTDEPGFDPLATTIREAHARGIAVHAWVNTHLVWSGRARPADPAHLVNAHPRWLAVPRALATRLFAMDPADPRYTDALLRYAAEHASTVEGLFSSPSDPEVQEHVFDIWMDLADHYDLDGIHFDYIRFPSADFDYSRGALDRFREHVAGEVAPERRAALDAAYRTDPFAYTDALPDAWDAFRRAQITDLVARIHGAVKAQRPPLVVSAAVFADREDAHDNRFQDWPAWLERGIVDVVVPMAYTTEDDRFTREMEGATAAAGRRDRLWAGIGAWLNGYDRTVAKIDIARRLGAGGVILFSYDWAAREAPAVRGVPFLVRVGRDRFGR